MSNNPRSPTSTSTSTTQRRLSLSLPTPSTPSSTTSSNPSASTSSSTLQPMPSSSSSSSSSVFISPNHPAELKKANPLPFYESGFSVKSYIHAAEGLIERARGSDQQGSLEDAFLNYRKAAAIISFCPTAPDFKDHRLKKDETWRRFKNLQESTPELISRCNRVEELLREREERNASTLLSTPSRSKASSNSSTPTSTGHVASTSTHPSTTPLPSNSNYISVSSNPISSNSILKDLGSLNLADSNRKENEKGNGKSDPNSLAARLEALKNQGMSSEVTSSGNKRISKGLGRSSAGVRERSESNRSGKSEEDSISRSREREEGEEIRNSTRSPSPAIEGNLDSIAENLRKEVRDGKDVVGQLGYVGGSGRNQNQDRKNGINEEEEAQDQDQETRFPHIPTASEFNSQYPSLDDFEKSNESQFPGVPNSLPSSSSSKSGGGSRPLPMPPSKPNFDLMGDVPKVWEEDSSREYGPSSTTTNQSSSTSGKRVSRPPPPIPTSAKPSFTPTSSRPLPSTSGIPMPGSGKGETGLKPPLPEKYHISVEDLYSLLHPGFSRSETEPGSGVFQILTKVGLEILLIDLRSREEFENGRIKGLRNVCLDPWILDRINEIDEIEDKLLISPEEEQVHWSKRGEVDLVVLYDSNSRNFERGKESREVERLNRLYQILMEDRNSSSSLKHHPVILIGGIESWQKHIGEDGMIRASGSTKSSSSPQQPTSVTSPRENGRSRYSLSYESSNRFNGPKESPDSRSSLDISRTRMNDQNSFSSSEEAAKKARRNAQILPNGFSSHSNPSNTSLPASLIPARSPLQTSNSSNGAGTGGFGSNSFANLGTGLSMPARTYQSGGVGSSPNVGTSNVRDRFNDDYFQQQQYSSSIPKPASRQNSLGNGSFEYPQLSMSNSSSNASTPQATSHSHSHSHSHSTSSQALSTPQPAAVAHGISARVPHSNAIPSDGSRSPVPPTSVSNDLNISKRPIPTSSLSSIPNRGYYVGKGHIDQQIHIGMTGLKNVGNSCYMNATLQCLSASLPLSNFMLSGKYKEAINRVNPLGTQGALASAFAGLIHVLWSEQYTFVSPVTFREALTRFAPSFRGYDQHDSQEFLVFLLDGLHEDLNYVINKPPPVEVSKEREQMLETLPQQIASIQEWEVYRRRNNSIIVDQFQGQFRNKMTCLTCGTTSTTYNAFVNLSLPIPHGKGISKVTLQQCLDAFVREEVMDKADAWHCPSCKKPRKATKKLSISRLPKLLLIHLKRFSFRGPFTDKIETPVDFPKQGLDLTNYMPPPLPPNMVKDKNTPISLSQQPPYIYDLYAVTHHFGSLNTGHYTATIRNDGNWWYYDDSVVSKRDERQLNTNSPYVLWFRRRL